MQDLFSARVGTLTLLGIEWQLPDFLALHGEAQVALNERLNQQCEEVQREQRLDPSLVLQEYRRNFVYGLDLFEALLDHRLALMRLQDLSPRQAAIIGNQWVHSVASVVIGHRRSSPHPWSTRCRSVAV